LLFFPFSSSSRRSLRWSKLLGADVPLQDDGQRLQGDVRLGVAELLVVVDGVRANVTQFPDYLAQGQHLARQVARSGEVADELLQALGAGWADERVVQEVQVALQYLSALGKSHVGVGVHQGPALGEVSRKGSGIQLPAFDPAVQRQLQEGCLAKLR